MQCCTGKYAKLFPGSCCESGDIFQPEKQIAEFNRLPSSAIDDEILYERWHGKSLQKNHLKLLKPFGCIVWDNVPKDNRKKHRRNKLFDHGTNGCFIGYASSSTYSHYDFS